MPTAGTYPFSEVLKYRLAALVMADRATAVRLRGVLRPEFFGEDSAAPLRVAVETVLDHVAQWQQPPSWEVLDHLVVERISRRLATHRGEDRAAVVALHRQTLRRLREADVVTDRAWLEAQAVEHAEDMALHGFVMRAAEALQGTNGDRPEVRRQLRQEFGEALAIGVSARDQGIRYSTSAVGVAEEYLSGARDRGRILTGWTQVDRVTRGIGNELVVIAGEPSSFKTGTCVNLSVNVMAQGKYVAWAAFEGDEPSIMYRHVRRTMRVERSTAVGMPDVTRRASILRFVRMGGELALRFFNRTRDGVAEVVAWLTQLASEGRRPDLLIVDYADKMRPVGRRYERRWEGEAENYDALYALSREFPGGKTGDGIPVVTPCQVGRGSTGKRVVGKEDLAGAFEKAAIADVILAICQTPYERNHLVPEILRLYGAKVREAEDRGMAWFKCHKDQMLLEETGPVPLPDDRKAGQQQGEQAAATRAGGQAA